MTKNKEKIFIEHEESPSGTVYFYNYKEPLMKFEGGFGFEGALVFDSKTDKIQCHFCGEWFEALGHHLHREHNISAVEYKARVGLNKSTALINEKVRSTLIAKGLEKRLKNLRPGKKHLQATKNKIAATLKENRAEIQNKNGTCPAQLIERLVWLHDKLGRTPTQDEIPFLEALKRVYGNLREACLVAGIPYRKPGKNIEYRVTWTQERVKQEIKNFYDKHGKVPEMRALNKSCQAAIYRYGKKEMFKEALAMDGKYRKTPYIFRYDKHQLIEFIRHFEKLHNRKPSYSDCKRGLLPNLSRYSYNFGSWKNALTIAFP